ncbi:MAG: nucleoside 2-deoxyribosyltransferase [Spirochaetota bacterium]
MRLYIAGPLFTPYHRGFHVKNIQLLREAGYDCFVPQEQEHNTLQSRSVPAQVFQVDLNGLIRANALIALLDGPDVSSGTACEMGIFYELARQDPGKKGILSILTDERSYRREASQVGESLNFFTLGCAEKIGRVYSSIDGILEHLARWRRELEESK